MPTAPDDGGRPPVSPAAGDRRPPWDFGYAPVTPAAGAPAPALELLVATLSAVDPGAIAEAAGPHARARTLIGRAPLFWTHLVVPDPALPEAVGARLRDRGLPVRYVASAERPSLAL